ncbi:MAG TPA: PLP-dependent aminotransferase family protein [Bryobacteraceae bacterium]|nr:PLP-dependent aminotransferase family protein [Bryobacteraceae bacterium]
MVQLTQLDPQSEQPLYRQLYDKIRHNIKTGVLESNERLPATRELAGQLGLNRTTVSAAYALLEADGLIKGHVGRGSFVASTGTENVRPRTVTGAISFASSRPCQEQFPVTEFQASCREVISGPEASTILQLGSTSGYGPLRQYLLDEAVANDVAGPDDDILITNGCQQALDLLQRLLVNSGDTVVMEDPVYHGVKNVFGRGGARVIGVPMRAEGIDVEQLGRVLMQERPKLLVITSNFQNPTGATLPLNARQAIASLVQETGVLLVENDIYGDLRYTGDPLPTVKQIERGGSTILLRSFSKIAFPGLRVGWVIAPRHIIARLTETKQWCDLHTDQLSQAILLRFAASGRLAALVKRVRTAGAERLKTALAACERYLPAGSEFTRPEGGMSLWVRLPEPLDAADILPRAQREGISYVPGRHFSVSQYDPGGLRLSFGGLSPAQIEAGLGVLGKIFQEELERSRGVDRFDAAAALV